MKINRLELAGITNEGIDRAGKEQEIERVLLLGTRIAASRRRSIPKGMATSMAE